MFSRSKFVKFSNPLRKISEHYIEEEVLCAEREIPLSSDLWIHTETPEKKEYHKTVALAGHVEFRGQVWGPKLW